MSAVFLCLPRSIFVCLSQENPKPKNQKKETTHQLTSLTNVGDSAIPALASTIDDLVSPMKSVDTTASSVMPRFPPDPFPPYLKKKKKQKQRTNSPCIGDPGAAAALTHSMISS